MRPTSTPTTRAGSSSQNFSSMRAQPRQASARTCGHPSAISFAIAWSCCWRICASASASSRTRSGNDDTITRQAFSRTLAFAAVADPNTTGSYSRCSVSSTALPMPDDASLCLCRAASSTWSAFAATFTSAVSTAQSSRSPNTQLSSVSRSAPLLVRHARNITSPYHPSSADDALGICALTHAYTSFIISTSTSMTWLRNLRPSFERRKLALTLHLSRSSFVMAMLSSSSKSSTVRLSRMANALLTSVGRPPHSARMSRKGRHCVVSSATTMPHASSTSCAARRPALRVDVFVACASGATWNANHASHSLATSSARLACAFASSPCSSCSFAAEVAASCASASRRSCILRLALNRLVHACLSCEAADADLAGALSGLSISSVHACAMAAHSLSRFVRLTSFESFSSRVFFSA
mmetsp:Transcript_7373/g.19185  ORF Transcript_7373/g.19185 Transcript_7373/m.19185 type:complete len:412 (+) Transcript_7373:532-1767(+)